MSKKHGRNQYSKVIYKELLQNEKVLNLSIFKCFYIYVRQEILGEITMANKYVSLLSTQGNGNYVSLLSTNKGGGETAGSVARSVSGIAGNIAYMGGETAGSVACSGGSSSSCSSGGSFSAIA